MNVFIQIGTNNGDDNFRKLVLKHKPSRVILIEPNSNLYEVILKNYKDIPNVIILNRAIYYEDNKPVDLYIGAKNKEYGSLSDNGIIYTDSQFSLVPMNDWGDKSDMVQITANSIRFDTLCSMLNISEIDYLQIDTEGFDSEIIDMIDFNIYTIHQLRYENWGFNMEAFTKHNDDKAHILGKAGMERTANKLAAFGYTLNNIRDEDGNDIIASRKPVKEIIEFYKIN